MCFLCQSLPGVIQGRVQQSINSLVYRCVSREHRSFEMASSTLCPRGLEKLSINLHLLGCPDVGIMPNLLCVIWGLLTSSTIITESIID